MLKFKTTNKDIRNCYENIIKVGYNNMEYLLYFHRPSAYNSGVYGWNSDFYIIKNEQPFFIVCISTGYRPIGNIKVNRTKLEQYESKAREIVENRTLKNRQEKVEKLLIEFLITI